MGKLCGCVESKISTAIANFGVKDGRQEFVQIFEFNTEPELTVYVIS
jgi:hypothetical protein